MAFHCVRDTRVIVAPFAFLLLSIPVAALPANQESGAISSPSIGAPHVSAVSELAQMTIEQRVIIRVPMVRRAMPRHEDRAQAVYDGREDASEWVERPGPRCVKIKRVTGASIISPRGVDLMLRGDERMRARLGRGCRPADLSSGFYIQPNEDGVLCAGRDRVLARSGADCEIKELVRLVPDR